MSMFCDHPLAAHGYRPIDLVSLGRPKDANEVEIVDRPAGQRHRRYSMISKAIADKAAPFLAKPLYRLSTVHNRSLQGCAVVQFDRFENQAVLPVVRSRELQPLRDQLIFYMSERGVRPRLITKGIAFADIRGWRVARTTAEREVNAIVKDLTKRGIDVLFSSIETAYFHDINAGNYLFGLHVHLVADGLNFDKNRQIQVARDLKCDVRACDNIEKTVEYVTKSYEFREDFKVHVNPNLRKIEMIDLPDDLLASFVEANKGAKLYRPLGGFREFEKQFKAFDLPGVGKRRATRLRECAAPLPGSTSRTQWRAVESRTRAAKASTPPLDDVIFAIDFVKLTARVARDSGNHDLRNMLFLKQNVHWIAPMEAAIAAHNALRSQATCIPCLAFCYPACPPDADFRHVTNSAGESAWVSRSAEARYEASTRALANSSSSYVTPAFRFPNSVAFVPRPPPQPLPTSTGGSP